jgi:hypothetical protein
MFLTSPYIDQAISLKSLRGRQMSVIEMFRHLTNQPPTARDDTSDARDD